MSRDFLFFARKCQNWPSIRENIFSTFITNGESGLLLLWLGSCGTFFEEFIAIAPALVLGGFLA